MMNYIFRDMIDFGLLAYIDDLLIYAKTEEEHDTIVKEVLQRLRANRLAISPEKYIWKQKEVEFLGYVIGREGIKMAEEKVKAVLEWKSPASLVVTQSFLGFANFYRWFICYTLVNSWKYVARETHHGPSEGHSCPLKHGK